MLGKGWLRTPTHSVCLLPCTEALETPEGRGAGRESGVAAGHPSLLLAGLPSWSCHHRSEQIKSPGPVPGAGLGKPTSIRHLPLSLGRTEQRCPPRRPRAGLRSGPPQLQGWTVACVGGCAVHRRMFSIVSDLRLPVPVAVARLPPSSSPHGLLRTATGHDSWPSPRQLIQEQGRGQSAC